MAQPVNVTEDGLLFGNLVATAAKDCRDTPPWVVDLLLDNFQLPTEHVIEPFAGRGRFVRGLIERGYSTTAVEVRPEMKPLLERYPEADIHIGTWAKYLYGMKKANVDFSRVSLVSNPPFSIAWQMVRLCRAANFRCIVFLLTLNFLASKKRRKWWRANRPTDLKILSRRPSYVESGATDARDYAFYIWERGRPPLWIDFLLPQD
jgi:hypothetical protein